MEDNFHINLADLTFGLEELDLLIKEWLKGPEPKTINELARLYLSLHYWRKTGYLPYDRRKQYHKGDVITLRSLSIPSGVFLAQVTEVSRNCMFSDGFSYDELYVVLLSQDATLRGGQYKRYISNYQGTEYAGPGVVSLQIIEEKDENEVIPKILTVISNDKRFVAFQQHWFLTELLIPNISDKLVEVRKIIAKAKCQLSMSEILGKLQTEDNKGLSNSRLGFSLNYFLNCDRRFVLIPDSVARWDLPKPSGDVNTTISKKTLQDGHLCILPDLDNLLFYHGCVDIVVFSFPYDHYIEAVYDALKQVLSGKEFSDELAKLSDEKEFKVKFGQPEQRGGPIRVYPISNKHDADGKAQSTVTIREDWIDKGIIIVPKRISNYMEGNNTVHIIYDQVDEIMPYSDNDGRIEGLKDFYSAKAIAEFDRVHLKLEGLAPARLSITATWQKSLEKLLSIEPQDLDWKHSSLRDCIIVTLAKFKIPMHYREIYTEIATHRNVSVSSIDATLSRYSPSVFVCVGSGKWQLTGRGSEKPIITVGPPQVIPTESPDENIWKIVQLIEENDYVYKLLQKIGRPLSFSDICAKLADLLKVDSDKLKATGFLKADDKHLRRLDDGTWALEEWFKKPPQVSEEDTFVSTVKESVDDSGSLPETSAKSGISKLFLAILLIMFFLLTIGGIILFWLYI